MPPDEAEDRSRNRAAQEAERDHDDEQDVAALLLR